MLLHDLLAPQGFRGTVLPTQLSLVDFEDCELSEDMKRNSIQWEYFCQVKKVSIQSPLQTSDRCVVWMLTDVTNNVVCEAFLKDTK